MSNAVWRNNVRASNLTWGRGITFQKAQEMFIDHADDGSNEGPLNIGVVLEHAISRWIRARTMVRLPTVSRSVD